MCFLLLSLFILLNGEFAQCTYQLKYTIQVYKDGSAFWSIEQIGVGIRVEWYKFIENVSRLLKACESKTNRSMSVDNNTFSISVRYSGSYRVIKYAFLWNGFGYVNGSRIEIGDVFLIENFFGYLYGDGLIYIKYPSEYMIEEVYPPPNEQYASPPTLQWYGIEDFETGQPTIKMEEKSGPPGVFGFLAKHAMLIAGLLMFLSGGLIGFYYFRLKKKPIDEEIPSKKFPGSSKPFLMIDDEEKVLNLLKAAGGSLYQSTIAERCRFSRAKVSKLLALMEKEGKIRRQKKGREKIVTIVENNEEESHT